MIDFDTEDFQQICNQVLASGQALPEWLEAALRKAKFNEQEKVVFDKRIIEQQQQINKPFNERINNLFADFDLHIPAEYFKYKTPELENALDTTKQNIKQFASEIQELSVQAGGNKTIENQAVKITENLLDRLKNDLGFSAEEKKQLEGKTPEEIAEYYSKTRSDKLDKLNESINGFRQELKNLEKSCEGKPKDEVAKIYQLELSEIEWTTQNKRSSSKYVIRDSVYEIQSISEIKPPQKTSQNISEESLKTINDKKTLLETVL